MFSVMQVGNVGASGMITDDSKVFWLYNLESEVVWGACGAPDKGGVSKIGSSK
jgi:hypothetical protein